MITIRNLNFSNSVFGTGIAAVLLLGAGLLITALTSEAQSSPQFGKGDRLDIQTRGQHCSQQVWPYYEATCLRSTVSGVSSNVRMVIADRRI